MVDPLMQNMCKFVAVAAMQVSSFDVMAAGKMLGSTRPFSVGSLAILALMSDFSLGWNK